MKKGIALLIMTVFLIILLIIGAIPAILSSLWFWDNRYSEFCDKMAEGVQVMLDKKDII